jgi:ATPase subunit of ABC transporter with duplicated ATPase domains
LYSGNYTFWYETSQMALIQRSASNKKKEEQIQELKTFIARFSANASKSRQASSRKKLLEKITLDDIRPSNRKYPFIQFKAERALGKEVVTVEGLRKTIGGEVLFDGLSFSIGRGERVALVGDDRVISALLDILAGESKPDAGTVTWGRSTKVAYFPKDNNAYFATDKSVLEWLRQYAPDTRDETFIRSFLGRMLFTSDEVHKKVKVLSGGERVRCMLSRLMLQDPNTLLLDQPTNHLDLESITSLNNGLLKSEASMIFSCHDVQFMESLANRVLELSVGSHHDLRMSYSEYLVDPDRLARVGRAAA